MPNYLFDLAKYPFMYESGELVRQTGFSLGDLDDRVFNGIIKATETRVRLHVGGRFNTEIPFNATDGAFTFLASCMTVHIIGIRTVTHKFALQEARRVEEFLKEETRVGRKREGVLQELYGAISAGPIESDPENPYSRFRMRVPEYLKMAADSPMQQFKLINRPVDAGWVYLGSFEALRFARDWLTRLIRQRCDFMPVNEKNAPKSVLSLALRMRGEFAAQFATAPRTLSDADFPPCVKHCIKYMAEGNNLSDAGRFFLASYLIANGRTIDEIVEYYKNAPDFSPKVTEYHLGHIVKERELSAGYRVTGCERLLQAGLCFRDETCRNIRNPMQYQRVREANTDG